MDYPQEYFETKDIQSLHRWVEENYKMFYDIVSKTIKGYNLYGQDEEELFSEAVIIFYDIIDTYDVEAGKFSTYMYRAISNNLLTKIRNNRIRDFQRRVDTVNLDETLESPNGALARVEETISITDESAVMDNVLISNLREYVDTHLSPRKREIYNLYSLGWNIPAVAKELGVTKQYVSKVLKDLVDEVRKEWKIEISN